MAKAMVYTFLVIAFIIFLLSPAKRHSHHRIGLNRRLAHHRIGLNRRLAHHLTFDPLEENGMNIGQSISYVPEVEEDGVLNSTLRLSVLFPLLDNAPKDGLINSKELEAWISQQAINRLNYGTDRVMSWHDEDGDGALSFTEYQPQFTQQDIENNKMEHGEAGWWMEQFKNADVDSSGTLDFNECKDFLHPEDSENEEIQRWLLREKMKRMDDDHDGELNIDEFIHHAYHIFKSYTEFEISPVLPPTAEDKFAELDINKDNKLSVEELRPLFGYLYPGELFYAKYFTNYLIREADDDKDGFLTLQEMLDHESLFYNSLYENDYNDENDDNNRSEL